MITIVSPIYNEKDNLRELVRQVTQALESCGQTNFEYCLVENGSTDGSHEVIAELHQQDPRVRMIRLSRNFGHQGAILAGMTHARGEAVITLDGDLQHPPSLLPQMIQKWQEGHHVVYTTKREASENGWRKGFKMVFYSLMSRVSSLKLSYGQSDFRLLDRRVVEVIKSIPEKNIFLRGVVEWLGFSQVGLSYEVAPRYCGTSKFSLTHYFRFAMDGIFSFSTVPLKFFLFSGLVIAGGCLLHALWFLLIFIQSMLNGEKVPFPPGWATLSVSIFFLGAVQLIGIGVLGEYIARIYTQIKGRPSFVLLEDEADAHL